VLVRKLGRNNKTKNKKVKKMKLYVGGINYNTTEDALREYFSGAGEVVSVSVIIDKMTNRSKGFGFIEYANEEDGKKAIEMFDGKEFEGRNLKVNEARPMEERPRRDFNNGGGY